jgi:light-regulated signal transduction histidine kinase (bacteriophytochrome)
MEHVLEERTTALEAANHELEAFSYSVSHDLRAPLRAIDGFAHILVDDHGTRLDDEGHRVLDVICQNARQMGRLIDDLLALSRLGRRTLDRRLVDMRALAATVVAEVRQLDRGRDAAVTIEPLPSIAADSGMMHQVMANLVGNAWKFTAGTPDAAITIGASAGERETVYFVKDNGAGFNPAYAAKLFGVFQRLHSTEEFEGTGIGLATVRRIVERHGGRVWADGAVGCGATFFFALPAAAIRSEGVEA